MMDDLPSAKPTKDLAYNWFMGASRARQLLAVVETVSASAKIADDLMRDIFPKADLEKTFDRA